MPILWQGVAYLLAFLSPIGYNKGMEALLLANNLTEGAIIALKMMAGVLIAAVLLYLVLILSRVLGTKLEEKKYEKYCEKYRAEHGNEDGMLSKEDYIETRAKGNAVIWRRQDTQPDDTSASDTPTPYAVNASNDKGAETSTNPSADEPTNTVTLQAEETSSESNNHENSQSTEIHLNDE